VSLWEVHNFKLKHQLKTMDFPEAHAGTQGSPLRQSQDRKSAMDRSQIIGDRSADLINRDAAAAYRYRSKSPIHGPQFEELRQQQYHSRFGVELAGGARYHRTSATNVHHLSPEPVHVTQQTRVVPDHRTVTEA
jgi:hypothetical protein